jgi:O-antigen/teichoic acid export membrane protein
MTGTTIAQAIPIAISPILTRIYTPEDFGMFALYMSIASILSVIATGRYELAIMLPRKDEDAINLLALSVAISFFVSLMSLLIVFIYNSQITKLLGNPEISLWLYFIPITVLLTGIYQSFNYWSNRKKQYKRLAASRIIHSGATATTNLGIVFFSFSSYGLIIGGVLGQLIATSVLARMAVWDKDKILLQKVKRLKMVALSKKYHKFPKFDMPSSIMYSVYSNMAIIFFSKFFEALVSGLYFFANRIIRTPFSFFISSFSDVFYQKISKLNNYSDISKEVNFYSIKLFKTTFIPFLIIIYSSYFYVELLFGEKWEELYVYMYIFSLPIYIGLLLSPYGHILKIINKQEISFYLHAIKLLVLGVFFLAYIFTPYKLIDFLLYYSIIEALLHLIFGFVVDNLLTNKDIVSINIKRFLILCTFVFLNYCLLYGV